MTNHTEISERILSFVSSASTDISIIMHVGELVCAAIVSGSPMEFSILPATTNDCFDITMGGMRVFSVFNYYTFPVKAVFDQDNMSEDRRDVARNISPFVFSGPAPTMAVWSGTDVKSVPNIGYPALTENDAKSAFAYWLKYVFGVTLNQEDNTVS